MLVLQTGVVLGVCRVVVLKVEDCFDKQIEMYHRTACPAGHWLLLHCLQCVIQ